MNLWSSTEQITIQLDSQNGQNDQSGLGRYRLYESSILTGMKFVFRNMLAGKGKEEKQPEWLYQKDESNILAFIGDRGAGKTTAMKEFCKTLIKMNGGPGREILNDWLQKVLDPEDVKKLQGCSVRFHVLNLIDAGLLNESEDLLEQILINLFQAYESEIGPDRSWSSGYQTNVMEIQNLFENLLEMYRSMRGRNGSSEDYTLATLSRMAGSGTLMRKKIRELLTQMRKVQRQKADYEYYIIAIDDLDLNLGNGYTMLEQLQKYFSDEQLIILLTMDYEQLCDVCMEHFHRAMEFTDGLSVSGVRSRSQMLATDMMTKVFPYDQRIFLPDARKQGKQMQILMTNGAENPDKSGEAGLPVKRFIMQKVAECMHIFYDADGQKRHFCEPDTVRQFVFYNDFLNSMYHVRYRDLKPWQTFDNNVTSDEGADEKKTEEAGYREREEQEKQRKINLEQLAKYDQNHHRFNDDISKRQAQTTLAVSQKQFFKALMEIDLSRRALYFERAEHLSEEGPIRIHDVSVEERNNCSYADFLEKIYTLGRKHYEDKPLISCVLASFTSEMVREYVNFRYQPDKESREKSRNRLASFLGKTVTNRWLIRNTSFFDAPATEKTLKNISSQKAEVGNGKKKAGTSRSIYFADDADRDAQARRDLERIILENGYISPDAVDLDLSKTVENAGDDSQANTKSDAREKYIRMKSASICFDLQHLEKEKMSIIPRGRTENFLARLLKNWFAQEKVVETLECMDMFLMGQQNNQVLDYNGPDMEILVDMATTNDIVYDKNTSYGKAEEHICVRVRYTGECIVDFFGFIPKSLDYVNRMEDIDRKIINKLTDVFVVYLRNTNLEVGHAKLQKMITEILKERSIFREERLAPGKYEVVFPFYNADLAYNIFKRFRARTSDPANENLLGYVIKNMKLLEEQLKEEEREYEGTDFPYQKIFCECPYVETLRSFWEEDGKSSQRIANCLGRMCGQSTTLESPEDTSV